MEKSLSCNIPIWFVLPVQQTTGANHAKTRPTRQRRRRIDRRRHRPRRPICKPPRRSRRRDLLGHYRSRRAGRGLCGRDARSAARRRRVDLSPPLLAAPRFRPDRAARSEEHTSELQSLMRISYAVFCLKIKKKHIVNKLSYYLYVY